jgi:hypothetical protein
MKVQATAKILLVLLLPALLSFLWGVGYSDGAPVPCVACDCKEVEAWAGPAVNPPPTSARGYRTYDDMTGTSTAVTFATGLGSNAGCQKGMPKDAVPQVDVYPYDYFQISPTCSTNVLDKIEYTHSDTGSRADTKTVKRQSCQ